MENQNSTEHMRKPLREEHLQQYLAVVRDLAFGFEAVSDHVVITDPDANIIYANKAAEKNTGFSQDEMIGKNPADLWGGHMPKDFYERMWHTIKIEKYPFVDEIRNKRKDNTEYWQEIHISPVLWDNGDVKFFIGIEPNITERKNKEKFHEEFISILAHQLKNPMASFKWTLNWLSMRGNLTKEQQEAISEIYKTNESLIALVSDLLIISRIGNAEFRKKEEIDLVGELEHILENVKAQHQNISFSFEHDGSFSIMTNLSLASQVFANLILNAAEYSDQAIGNVKIKLKREDDTFLLSVENNGMSIPEKEQQQIFSKFFRASNAKTIKENGTGLGLYIAKIICDAYGWNIWFESPLSPDGGTVFFISIPLKINL